MKIDFWVYCSGYSVGGRDYPFEIEIDDNELNQSYSYILILYI